MTNVLPAALQAAPRGRTAVSLTVHTQSRELEIGFDDGQTFSLPFELMRVYSPSAEVRGHGPGQDVLQTGKRDVTITGLEPVGNYAVQPVFSDGHYSGLFSWDYLYHLGLNREPLWDDYLQRLQAAGYTVESGRAPSAQTPAAPSGGSCGHKH